MSPISGEVDFLFAATLPSEELKAQAEAAGVELECVPIAYDAMVFFTNAENAIDGLSQQQIQDIYVYGKYANWNQVGGPDAELLPYRRNADSGSHALMEQYFLEGGKLSLSPDVHNVLTSYAMSSALTDVAQALRTDPPAYAMGYSVYYYYVNSYWLLGDVNGGGELKLLAVDGVLPSDETIADGSYPLAGYNDAVFRADEPEGSPARRLAAFMLSAAGQDCVRNAGFGPLSNDPLADFEAANPGCMVETILPAEAGGYVVLSPAREPPGQLSGARGRGLGGAPAGGVPAAGGGAPLCRRAENPGQHPAVRPDQGIDGLHRPAHLRRRADGAVQAGGLRGPVLPPPAGWESGVGEAGAAPGRAGAVLPHRLLLEPTITRGPV